MAKDVGLSLEQPGEIVGVGEATSATSAAVEAAKTPVVTADDADPEGTITGEGGVKFVPVGAVIAERGKRKDAEAKLKDVETLRQKAAAYDKAAVYLQEASPIIEAVKRRPELIRLAQESSAPPAGPLTPQEAEEYARDLDLYDSAGKPDVARAQRLAGRQAKLAEGSARAAVAPLQQTEAARQSAVNFQHYAGQKDAAGNARVDLNVLREVWAGVPADMAARPDVAQVLYLTALGKQTVDGTAPRAATVAPVVTESLGGGRPESGPLTETDLKFMRAAGMNREAFQKTRDTFKPGANNFLEE